MTATMETAQTAIVNTTRFGDLNYTETEVIAFPWGIPGFEDARRFLALTLEDQPNFVWLQSIDRPELALPCADPWQIFANYEPRLPGYVVSALDVQNPEDFTILNVVVVTKDAEEMTMNLLAPIVINLKTNRGRQVMLENSGYSAREPIPRKAALAP